MTTEREVLSLRSMLEEYWVAVCHGTTYGVGSYLLNTACNLPEGKRLRGCYEAFNKVSPQLCKYPLLLGATLCTVDFTTRYVRQKNDRVNKINAGAVAAGLLAIRVPGVGLPYRCAYLLGALIGISDM